MILSLLRIKRLVLVGLKCEAKWDARKGDSPADLLTACEHADCLPLGGSLNVERELGKATKSDRPLVRNAHAQLPQQREINPRPWFVDWLSMRC